MRPTTAKMRRTQAKTIRTLVPALTSLLVVALLCPAAARVRQGPEADKPRLVDSFGEILISDLKARLDNFALELQENPNARGVIVVYGARNKFPGWPLRRAETCAVYLERTRGVAEGRLSVINAGLADGTRFELWAVPPGPEPPAKPFDVSLLMTGERNALPFDRFTVRERGDPFDAEYYDIAPGEGDPALYKHFVEALRADPSLRGCLIAYTSRRGERAADRRIAARAKRTMAKALAVDIRRVVAFGGGRREDKIVELWLVPPGAEMPKPTPDRRPVRRPR